MEPNELWDGVPENWGRGHYRDIPWSSLVRKTRERQIRDLKRAQAGDPDFPFYFDWEASQRAVDFIQMLRHIDGEWAGKPFILSDWQEWDVVRPLFGWMRRSGGRRFRDAFMAVARKNGKSALIAAISDYLLIADNEYGAQVYAAATKEEQAKIVFEMARKMIEFSPELRGEIRSFKKSFVCEHLGARFMPLGRDSKTMDGFSPHCGVIDEYHAHKTSEMYDVIDDGRGARRQPILLTITTAGFNVSSPCKKEWDVAVKILNQLIVNESYFCFIATVDHSEDEITGEQAYKDNLVGPLMRNGAFSPGWQTPDEWWKANPNMGISIYEEGFNIDFQKAVQSPQKHNSFKTKRLNIWTEQVTKWISMEKFQKCDGEINLDFLKGRRCFAGLDLGRNQDISALCLAFMGEDRDEYNEKGEKLLPEVYLLMKYWIPEVGKYERYKNDGVNYPQWCDEGWISTTPGETTRNDWIRKDINLLREEYEIAELAADPAHGHELLQDLADDGLEVIKHGQGFTAMNSPCISFEDLILNRRLKHGNDPVFRWMVSNVAVIKDGFERIRVIKEKSGDRVDGVVAACMAIGRLLIAPEPRKSVYLRRGLVAL